MSDVASFTFTRTKRDYFDAILLNAVRSPGAWVVLLASPIINGLIMGYYSYDGPIEVSAVAITLVALASATVVAAVLLFCYYLAARNAWRSPGFLRPIAFEFSDAGMKASSEVGAGESMWAAFDAAFENKSLIILRQRPGSLLILPKRNADPNALARLRALLRAHVKNVRLEASAP